MNIGTSNWREIAANWLILCASSALLARIDRRPVARLGGSCPSCDPFAVATVQREAIESTRPVAAEDSVNPRTVQLILTVATIVAAALRLPFLSHQSLWLDEIYTREIIRESSLAGLWNHVEATESTPPLYYFLGWLFTRSTVAMRLIPALALIAAVPVSYLAFCRLIGSRVALATAAILAVNPMLVWYSTDARSYGLFVLTALLSLWAFSALLERTSTQRFVLWVVASMACVWTHYFGIFVVGGEAAVLLIARPGVRRATVGWTALLGVCLIPLVPLVTSQSGDERAGFIAGIPLSTRLSETVRQFAMGPNVPRTTLEASGLLVFCVAVVAGGWMAWRSPRRSRILLVLSVIAFATPLLLALFRIEDRFYARNIIAALPLVAALAAPAMLRIRAVPLVLYLVLATVASVWVTTDWRYEQADWKAALARAKTVDPAAPVIAVTEFSGPVVQTYLARQPVTSTGVVAQQAWVIVEPTRAAGHRALGPAPAPSLPGFVAKRAIEVQGFRLVLDEASQPTRIVPSALAGTTVFASSSTVSTAEKL
jgi:4-amino-4-deoxy-L-arabinose transferase-like glycosyltransferase